MVAEEQVKYIYNSPYREEIRVDFPPILELRGSVDLLREDISSILENNNLANDTHISIVYPQKDLEVFRDLRHRSDLYVDQVFQALRAANNFVNWKFRSDVFEDRALERSEDQSVVYALTCKQQYSIKGYEFRDTIFQGENIIVADHSIDSGTTIANIVSFIEQNGGNVLAAAALSFSTMKDVCVDSNFIELYSETYKSAAERGNISQSATVPYEDQFMRQEPEDIPAIFLQESRNNKRLVHLANAFSLASKREGINKSSGECIVAFEKAINRHGNSVFALTNNECAKISYAMLKDNNGFEFSNLINSLNKIKVDSFIKTPPYSPLV